MENIKEISIKTRTYYFFNDMINIKNFSLNLLKIDKKSYKNIGIYNIGYITITLNLHILTIIVRSVFEDEGKSCPQIYLDDSLYDLLVKRH